MFLILHRLIINVSHFTSPCQVKQENQARFIDKTASPADESPSELQNQPPGHQA